MNDRMLAGRYGIDMSQQGYRDRQTLLKKVHSLWIEGVLENSLHNKVQTELGLEVRSQALEHPWSIAWETPEVPRKEMSPETKAIALLDGLGVGRTLLILGAPAAGKTTTLLEITRDLIHRAETEPSLPIPVVFNLLSWQEGQSLADWLVLELKAKYQVRKKVGRELIEHQQLQLMLDGLNEVGSDRGNTCIEAINHFHQQYSNTEIVVCYRLHDYEERSQRLQFQGTIFIQELTDVQIDRYFAQMGESLSGVREMVATETKLMELARSPLMLNIISIAYQGKSIAELTQIGLLEDRTQHLFDAYIDNVLQRYPSRKYKPKQTKYWLSWLAKQLVRDSQTTFLIERLQPESLSSPLRSLYAFLVGVIISVPAALLISTNLAIIVANLVNLDALYGWFASVDSVNRQLGGGDLPVPLNILPSVHSFLYSPLFIFVAATGGLTTGCIWGLAKTIAGKFSTAKHRWIAIKSFTCLFSGYLLLVLLFALLVAVAEGNPLLLLFLCILWALFSFILWGVLGKPIAPIGEMHWSWQSARGKAFEGQVWGVGLGILAAILLTLRDLGVFTGLVINFSLPGSTSSSLSSLPFLVFIFAANLLGCLLLGQLVGFLLGGFLGGLSGKAIETTTIPNQGILRTLQRVVLFAILTLGFLASIETYERISEGTTSSPGFIWVLVLGVFSPCVVLVKHLILRVLLFANRAAPWNYAKFLNYATRSTLLKRVGGSYVFIHNSLLEHFARK